VRVVPRRVLAGDASLDLGLDLYRWRGIQRDSRSRAQPTGPSQMKRRRRGVTLTLSQDVAAVVVSFMPHAGPQAAVLGQVIEASEEAAMSARAATER
jgi:hypothetical protein